MLKLKRADYAGNYHGFTLKEGYYYGTDTESGTLIATSGWECAGNLCVYFLNSETNKWAKEWVGIEENDFDINPLPEFNPVGKMSFFEWLKQEYSVTPEEWDESYSGFVAAQIEEQYDKYFYDGLPRFIQKYL